MKNELKIEYKTCIICGKSTKRIGHIERARKTCGGKRCVSDIYRRNGLRAKDNLQKSADYVYRKYEILKKYNPDKIKYLAYRDNK